jgi:hypothetical protein
MPLSGIEAEPAQGIFRRRWPSLNCAVRRIELAQDCGTKPNIDGSVSN